MTPHELTAARDAAFQRYGALERLEKGESRCLVTANPATVDDTGAPIGQIGDIEYANGDLEPLLDAAASWLRDQGCKIMRGPISRHTWYPFRALRDGWGAHPPLTGEPWNSPDLVPRLRRAGLREVAWYVSTWTTRDLQVTQSTAQVAHLEDAGYSVRTFEPARAARELSLVHSVTCDSFHAPFNYMFSPIDLAEFQLVVGPTAGAVVPELFLICNAPDETPAGFCYCTREGDSASIKTLVVSPNHRGAGIGSALVALIHARCRDLGIRRIIHALMRQGGPSVAISDRGEHQVFRRYVVMERSL